MTSPKIFALKSSTTRLYIQQLVQAYVHYCSFVKETTGDQCIPPVTGGFPPKRAINAESFPMPWRHHVFRPCQEPYRNVLSKAVLLHDTNRMMAISVRKRIENPVERFEFKLFINMLSVVQYFHREVMNQLMLIKIDTNHPSTQHWTHWDQLTHGLDFCGHELCHHWLS